VRRALKYQSAPVCMPPVLRSFHMRDETRVLCYLPIANGVAVAFSSLFSNQGGVAVCTDTEERGTE
jgi:hypothetical protein